MTTINIPRVDRPRDAVKRAVTARLNYDAKLSKADSLLRRFSWQEDGDAVRERR